MSVAAIFQHPLGRLQLSSLPFYQMLQDPTQANLINGSIGGFAASLVVIGAVALIALITYYGKWRVLWTQWLTSLDHKK